MKVPCLGVRFGRGLSRNSNSMATRFWNPLCQSSGKMPFSACQRKREVFPDLVPILRHSCGIIGALLQEDVTTRSYMASTVDVIWFQELDPQRIWLAGVSNGADSVWPVETPL